MHFIYQAAEKELAAAKTHCKTTSVSPVTLSLQTPIRK
jgi:hypothetical protein